VDAVLSDEDVLVSVGEVVTVGLVAGVVAGLVTGVVVGLVTGDVEAATAGVVTGVVEGGVTCCEVARLAGADEEGHVTLTGTGPTSLRRARPADFGIALVPVPAVAVWLGLGCEEDVPLTWRTVRAPAEPWSRHWSLLAGMVASQGFPAMYVGVPLPIGVALSDWAPPAGPRP